MNDPTEEIRRQEVAAINAVAGSRAELEFKHGRVWDTKELQEEFEVVGFFAPYTMVRRRLDGVYGSVMFQHNPRFYFDFKGDRECRFYFDFKED
jgi:hypothetical protein